ncbi:metallophosphoesterase family protein [Solimicrobium silvestre]|nr:metallophosphoesterase [Solimicrobium silvestre]
MYKSLLPLALLASTLIAHANTAPTTPSTESRDATITVYAAGDIADCRTKKSTARSIATATLINAGIADDPQAIVLTMGDHTYPVGVQAEFETCYQPSWGKFKDRTYPSPGNHEYYSPNGIGYYQYFGEAAGSQRQSYYSVNKGAWHIISLNSNLNKEDLQTQLDWLAQDLKKNRSACTLAYWHHPVYSSGLHGNNKHMKPVWEMLMAAKADVILSGHDHHYERFALQNSQGDEDIQTGIREFIVGTGGAKLAPVFWKKSNSEIVNTNTNGVLKLLLKKQGYEWQFLPIEGSSFTDQGSTACHSK